MDFNKTELDTEHGFQTEPGFTVDEVIGKLECAVITCHSDLNPEVKQRVVIEVPGPSGKIVARVHDFAFIRRAHGSQIIGDVWTFGMVTKARVLTIVKRILGALEVDLIEKLKKLLERH
jgi:hypothetical protein